MSAPVSVLSAQIVLVVENEYFLAMDIKGWLQAEGTFVLGPVATAEQALDLIETGGPPDLAVLDVNLGVSETAYPVAARLQELGVPFVFLTGEPDIRREFQTHPRVWRPYGEEPLLNALRRLVKA